MFNNYISIARGFLVEKNNMKALKFLKKAYECEEGKEDVELILDIALLYDKIGNPVLSKKMYKEVLNIDENEARAYYGIGVLYDESENFIEAIKYYKKTISIDENYDKAYFFLANCYDEIGEKESSRVL